MLPRRRRLRVIRFWIFALLFLGLLLSAATAAAQDADRVVTDDDVNAIARELYCPICESTPLDVCPTQACQDWREVIRTKLSEGQSEEEIKAYFELQYGARALAEPPKSGFSLTAWIIPFVLGAVAILGFIFYLLSIHKPSLSQSKSKTQLEEGLMDSQHKKEPDREDYTARVERELQEM